MICWFVTVCCKYKWFWPLVPSQIHTDSSGHLPGLPAASTQVSRQVTPTDAWGLVLHQYWLFKQKVVWPVTPGFWLLSFAYSDVGVNLCACVVYVVYACIALTAVFVLFFCTYFYRLLSVSQIAFQGPYSIWRPHFPPAHLPLDAPYSWTEENERAESEFSIGLSLLQSLELRYCLLVFTFSFSPFKLFFNKV